MTQRRFSHKSERGYVLITLILFVALLAIAAAVVAPTIAFQIKRDREEELIHRGVQYSRAIKHYVKKFGRYPVRIEELENTNNLRFLRKRYKDPVTGQDFKLLHLGDIKTSFGPGIAGATSVDAMAARNQAFGGQGLAGTNTPVRAAANSTDATASTPDSNKTVNDTNPPDADNAAAGATPPQGGFSFGSQPGANNAQVFGGGPIVGVASKSKEKTIRVFSKKDHYYQWQFIYDPTTDRGGLLTTPNQPPLQVTTVNGQPGQAGQPGQPGIGGPGSPGMPLGGFGGQQMSPGGMPQQQPQGLQPQMPPDQGPQPQ